MTVDDGDFVTTDGEILANNASNLSLSALDTSKSRRSVRLLCRKLRDG